MTAVTVPETLTAALGKWLDGNVAPDAIHWRDMAAAAYAAGAAAERERITALASRLGASFPADHPPGAMASFADWLRITGGDT